MTEIKKNESPPKVIKNLFSKNEINKFLNLYEQLPTTVHNKKQNVKKKRWLKKYGRDLEELFYAKLKNEIGDFKYDNLKTDDEMKFMDFFKKAILIGLHIDGGFNFEDLIYKQSLIPLTPVGSTVIFKNRYYGKIY